MFSFPNFLPIPKTVLTSSAEIELLPSLSNNLKASLSFSSYKILLLLIVAIYHSEKSNSAFPSISALLNIESTWALISS